MNSKLALSLAQGQLTVPAWANQDCEHPGLYDEKAIPSLPKLQDQMNLGSYLEPRNACHALSHHDSNPGPAPDCLGMRSLSSPLENTQPKCAHNMKGLRRTKSIFSAPEQRACVN